MMGAGKSSVGRRLARRLGIPFVDADAEIETAAGMTIPEIFAKHGEPYFRAGETRVIARLLDSGPQVLATGGGAIMDASTRALIRDKGVSIWLKADARRSDAPHQAARRPPAGRRRSRSLLPQRDTVLCARPTSSCTRATSRTTPSSTKSSRRCRKQLGTAAEGDAMTAQPLQPRAPSRSWCPSRSARAPMTSSSAAGCSRRSGARIAALRPGARVALVTDDDGGRASSRRRRAALKSAGIGCTAIERAAGRGFKTYAGFEKVCEAIIAARIERGDLVVALGGGVVGDLAGFAAACVRRGVDFVQVPTTLLAQVDSSVGGKTGINSRARQKSDRRVPPAGPGAWPTPRCSTRCRAREFRAGYAEVAEIRPARRRRVLRLAGDELAATCSPAAPAREHAIAVCCRGKAGIVARDERETGERALLNLGHTFGHALEAAAGLLRPAAARRSGRARHGAGVRILRPAQALVAEADAARVARASCGGRPADPDQGRARRRAAARSR